MTTAIDLARLPAPEVIPQLSFEAILSTWRAEFEARAPEATGILDAEGSLLAKHAQAVAWFALLVRQQANDQAKGCLLAYGWGATLDHMAALFGVERLVIQAADPSAEPPVPEIRESDDDLRRRVQLELEAFTTAATPGSILAAVLGADGGVRDASVTSPAPLEADIYVLGRVGNGTPDAAVLAAVDAAMSDRREFGKVVRVHAAEVVEYQIEADVYLFPGPAEGPVFETIRVSAEAFATAQHALARDITLSGLMAALHIHGVVQRVELVAPALPLVIDEHQAPYCTSITLNFAGRDE